jgi:hypothetical protein
MYIYLHECHSEISQKSIPDRMSEGSNIQVVMNSLKEDKSLLTHPSKH